MVRRDDLVQQLMEGVDLALGRRGTQIEVSEQPANGDGLERERLVDDRLPLLDRAGHLPRHPHDELPGSQADETLARRAISAMFMECSTIRPR